MKFAEHERIAAYFLLRDDGEIAELKTSWLDAEIGQ